MRLAAARIWRRLFPQTLQRSLTTNVPGHHDDAEESTAWPVVSRPAHLADSASASNGTWAGCTTSALHALDPSSSLPSQTNITFSLMYAFQEHFVLVLSHDEVVHGKGSPLTRCRATNGKTVRESPNVLRRMYGSGKKLLFMVASSDSDANGITTASRLGVDQIPRHDGCGALCSISIMSTKRAALWELDDTHESFDWIDFHDADNVSSFMRRSRAGMWSSSGECDPGGAAGVTGSAFPVRVFLPRNHQHPTRKTYGAVMSATWVALRLRIPMARTHAFALISCRRWRPSHLSSKGWSARSKKGAAVYNRRPNKTAVCKTDAP